MHPSDLIPTSVRPGAATSEDLVQAGELSLAAGRLPEALRLFAVAVRTDPRSTVALTAFGSALVDSGDLERGRKVLERSVAADPVQRGAWLTLASVELAEDRATAALGALDRALALGAPTPDLLELLIRARLSTGDVDGARSAAEHGVEQFPDAAALHAAAARVERAADNGEGAAAGLARAAELDPEGQARSWYELACSGAEVDELRLRAELDAALAAGGGERAAELHLALANLLARRGDGEALSQAAAAKADGGPEGAERGTLVDEVIATFDATYFAQNRGAGLRGSAPVFVVGPRGAARDRVARLLASHPKLERRVEAWFESLADEVEPATGLAFPTGCERLEPSQLTGIGHRFVEDAGTVQRGIRTVDDGADNLPNLGLVASCLPDARVIHVTADPRDAVVEALLRHRDDGGSSAANLAELSAEVAERGRLAEHWRQTLPLPMLEVDARSLQAEPGVQSARIFDFVGEAPSGPAPGEGGDLGVDRWHCIEAELRAVAPREWFDGDTGRD